MGRAGWHPTGRNLVLDRSGHPATSAWSGHGRSGVASRLRHPTSFVSLTIAYRVGPREADNRAETVH